MEYSVEVRYAGVVVGRGALVKDLGPEAAFVGIPEPLPVGTLVTLKIGDAVREARVDDVVESSDASAVGMRVRWGGVAAAPHPAPVTTPAAEVAEAERAPMEAAPPAPAPQPSADAVPEVVADSGSSTAETSGAPSAVAAGDPNLGRIAAPLSLAAPSGDGSHQGGGKRRRKRR